MNHDEIKKLISAYHDGELPEKKMEEVSEYPVKSLKRNPTAITGKRCLLI